MTEQKKLTAIIIDDEKESTDLLLDLLTDFPEINILKSYQFPEEGIKGIIKHKPDILFLDIQMPEKDGFDVLKEIREYNLNPSVVFITGYDKFAIQAVKHAAFDYLLKPVDPEELKTTIEKLKNQKQDGLSNQVSKLLTHLNSNVKLKFNTRTGFIIIDSSEIVYCLADRNYSEIYLADGRKEVITCNLKKLLKNLPMDIFFRASRSLIINVNYITKAERSKGIITIKYQDNQIEFSLPRTQIQALEDSLK
ncbi:MAG: LytTR family DNA-binding domain-containing protein [Bacteroidales bacterium]|nr:LytTR family DNA-binding domain-containing protein [Bacteroidales bacterium]